MDNLCMNKITLGVQITPVYVFLWVSDFSKENLSLIYKTLIESTYRAEMLFWKMKRSKSN